MALMATLRESEEVRRQTAAAVWPYLQMRVVDFDQGEQAALSVSFTNTGVGPAKVRALRLTLLGDAIRDWDQVVVKLGSPSDVPFARDFIVRRVLAPGESVTVFSTEWPQLVRAMKAAIASPDTNVVLCYCSIFDECWLADSGAPHADPSPIKDCPEFGAAQFDG
jgi:hypothetical protein